MLFRFLILDLEIEAVICQTDSASCANHLTRGLVNTKSVPIPIYYWTRFPQWRDKNFDNDLIKLTDDNGPRIFHLDPKLITDNFIKKREIAILRRNSLITIERYLEIPLLNSIEHFDSEMNFYIKNELENSNLEENKFSAAIIEYADMLEISPDRAHNELEFLFETQSRLRIRNLAVYKKYAEKINFATSQDELTKYIESFYKDCFVNARF